MSKTWIISMVVPALASAALAQDGDVAAPAPDTVLPLPSDNASPPPDTLPPDSDDGTAAPDRLPIPPDAATQNFQYCDLVQDGIIDMQDFVAFRRLYERGDIRANCDGSTVAPVLNVADFTCFIAVVAAAQTPWSVDMNHDGTTDRSDFEMFRVLFDQRDPRANCDGSTVEPVVNVADVTCFLTQYADSIINQTPVDGTAGILKESDATINQAKGTNLSGTIE